MEATSLSSTLVYKNYKIRKVLLYKKRRIEKRLLFGAVWLPEKS